MANLKASQKDVKNIEKRRLANTKRRSELRTILKGLDKAMESGNKEESMTKYREFTKKVDTAVRKNLIKLNTASRKKSRLAKRINKIGS